MIEAGYLACSLLVIVLGSGAAATGIGGGGIFVPLLILVGGFSPREAIPLSKCTIAGAAIFNFIQLVRRRHPFADRPMIDYFLAIILQPAALAGTTTGVLLNTAFPNWGVLACLLSVLSFASYRTFKKGFKKRRAENEKFKNAATIEVTISKSAVLDEHYEHEMVALAHDSDDEASESPEEHFHNASSGSSSPPTTDSSATQPVQHDEVEVVDEEALLEKSGDQMALKRMQILNKEQKFPWFLLLVMAGCLVILTVTTLMKGGHSQPSIIGIECGGAVYWVIVGAFGLLMLNVSLYYAKVAVETHQSKVNCNYPFVEGDIMYTKKRSAAILVAGYVAGVLASFIGIGGGMALNPVMLELHVLPEVAVATSAFLVLSTSLSSVTQYIILGRVQLSHGLVQAVLGAFASVLGQYAVKKMLDKTGRASYLIFMVASIIAVSTLTLTYIGTMQVIGDVQNGDVGFKSPCVEH